MAVLSPSLMNSFSSLLSVIYQVFSSSPQVFLAGYSKKLPSVKPKLKSAIGAN